jgi:hypothetical protein
MRTFFLKPSLGHLCLWFGYLFYYPGKILEVDLETVYSWNRWGKKPNAKGRRRSSSAMKRRSGGEKRRW